MNMKERDKTVFNHFIGLLEKGANGHDFLEDVTCGQYKGNNRAARIARLAWRTNASFHEAGKEPYFRNVLVMLTDHVMTFYKVDPGDSDIMRNVLVEEEKDFYERKVERLANTISGERLKRAILKSQIGELEKRLAATEVAIADLERAKDFACSRIVESHRRSWPSRSVEG